MAVTNTLAGSIKASLLKLLRYFVADAPWRAKSVMIAAIAIFVGLVFWSSEAMKSHPAQSSSNAPIGSLVTNEPTGTQAISKGEAPFWHKPVPGYVRVSFSYVGGFFIGWLFRRIIKLAILCTGLALAILAYGHFIGVDTTKAAEAVKRDSRWVQHQAAETRDYLKGLLPSATTGGFGLFFGFRRRLSDVFESEVVSNE